MMSLPGLGKAELLLQRLIGLAQVNSELSILSASAFQVHEPLCMAL